jgi:exosortase
MNSPAINFNKLWRPFLAAAALCFLYANVLAKLGKDWWTDDNYSHGLLIPFVIGYIIWLEFDDLKSEVQKPQFLFGGSLILFALLVLLGGTLGAELFTQRISLVLMLAGIVVYFWGAKILKMLAVPFALLLLAIPIPQIVFNKIAFPLQIYASQMAIWGIRFFGVASVRKGNVIGILPQGSTQVIALEVVEACSGIRSLMTLMTLALVLAYFTRTKRAASEDSWFDFLRNRDFWRAIILMLAAIPIAVFTNAARVTATGVLTSYYGKKALESVWHDFSGWLVYVAALVLLISVNFVLKAISRKGATAQTGEIENQPEISLPKVSASPRLRVSVSALIGILFIGGVFINWFEQRGEAETQRKPLREFPQRSAIGGKKAMKFVSTNKPKQFFAPPIIRCANTLCPKVALPTFMSVIMLRSARAQRITARKTVCPARVG